MSDEIVALYHKVISSNTSRKLILLLGEKKEARASELINSLNVSPGTLYDALKRLKGVVYKTSDGRYSLTEIGRRIYFMLVEETVTLTTQQFSNLGKIINSLPYVFPIPFFKKINQLNLNIYITLIFAVIFSNVISIMYSKLIPIVLFYFPPYILLDPFVNSLLYLINLAFTIVLTIFLSNLFGEIKNIVKFSLSLSLIFIPLLIFSFIYYLFSNIFLTLPFIYYLLIFLIPFFFSFTFLISCLYTYVNAKVEILFIISLLTILVSFVGLTIFTYLLLGIII